MVNQVTSKMKILKPVNDVFEAIVDPEKISNFWFSSGSGRMEQGRDITWIYEEYHAELQIHVLEIEENKKIVYKWGAEDQETVVSITFKELNNSSTVIEVNESGFNEEDPELINLLLGQKEGWVYMLTCLKGYLENSVKTLRGSLIH